jgi:hypothetical protein
MMLRCSSSSSSSSGGGSSSSSGGGGGSSSSSTSTSSKLWCYTIKPLFYIPPVLVVWRRTSSQTGEFVIGLCNKYVSIGHLSNHLEVLMLLFFWVLAPYRLVGRCQRFGETYCLHLHGWSGDAGKRRDLYRVRGREGWESLPLSLRLISQETMNNKFVFETNGHQALL